MEKWRKFFGVLLVIGLSKIEFFVLEIFWIAVADTEISHQDLQHQRAGNPNWFNGVGPNFRPLFDTCSTVCQLFNKLSVIRTVDMIPAVKQYNSCMSRLLNSVDITNQTVKFYEDGLNNIIHLLSKITTIVPANLNVRWIDEVFRNLNADSFDNAVIRLNDKQHQAINYGVVGYSFIFIWL